MRLGGGVTHFCDIRHKSVVKQLISLTEGWSNLDDVISGESLNSVVKNEMRFCRQFLSAFSIWVSNQWWSVFHPWAGRVRGCFRGPGGCFEWADARAGSEASPRWTNLGVRDRRSHLLSWGSHPQQPEKKYKHLRTEQPITTNNQNLDIWFIECHVTNRTVKILVWFLNGLPKCKNLTEIHK